jgi:phosphoribosylanthranilate isomerase
MKIKICGITRLEDARTAADAGAWAIGFVFYAKSPRFVAPELAREIGSAMPAALEKVGVFVNEDPAEVLRIARAAGLTRVQLHGDESAEYCGRIGLPITKVFRDSAKPKLAAYAGVVSALMLDSQAPAGVWGGTGRAADRDFARSFRALRDLEAPRLPFFLAGGLAPGSVSLAVRELRPDGLDVSSGVEDSPGIKSAAKIRAFIKEVTHG